ncbi:glycosidase [bacterium]|nr:glycosidase [bacterium]
MLKRFKGNPILEPIKEHTWEEQLVYNTAAIYLGGKVHLLYRGRDKKHVSCFGYASSKDGFHIDERLPEPVFGPQSEKDSLGCEDPRITKMGDTLYIPYTAFGIIPGIKQERKKTSVQIALTSISVDDFLNHRWNFTKRLYPIPRVFNKDCVILPEKFEGKYVIYHRIPPHIWVCYSEDLIHWYDHNIMMTPEGEWEFFKIGAGPPPIKTEKGWLFIYHGVSRDQRYRLGFAFLDLEDPRKVIYRHPEPILEAKEKWELEGMVPNVVFTCGAVLKDGEVFVYYGGGDTRIGVATAPLTEFFKLAGL